MVCSDTEKMSLDDELECEKAGSIIGKGIKTVQMPQWPEGCFVSMDDILYWNIHGDVHRHEDAGEICRLEGKNNLI